MRDFSIEGSGRVVVESEGPAFPPTFLSFGNALAARVRSRRRSAAVEQLRIRLLPCGDPERTWCALARYALAPVDGVLAALPPSPLIEVRHVSDEQRILLRRRGAGIVSGIRRSGVVDVYVEEGGRHFAWLLRFLAATPFVLWEDCDVIHGGAISFRGRTVVLAGNSGSGKSSLALLFALTARGCSPRTSPTSPRVAPSSQHC